MKSRIDFVVRRDPATGNDRYFFEVEARNSIKTSLNIAAHTFDLDNYVKKMIVEFEVNDQQYVFYYTFLLNDTSLKLGTFIATLEKFNKNGKRKKYSFKESCYYGVRHILNTSKIKYHDKNLNKCIDSIANYFAIFSKEGE